jgi:hypothetical protein
MTDFMEAAVRSKAIREAIETQRNPHAVEAVKAHAMDTLDSNFTALAEALGYRVEAITEEHKAALGARLLEVLEQRPANKDELA